MIQRIIAYYQNTLFPWEYGKAYLKACLNFLIPLQKNKQNKLRIGFCGVFPPFQNGGAAGAYYIVKELAKRHEKGELELSLIPLKGKIDKNLFSFLPKSVAYTKVSDPTLDVVIFWVLGDDFSTYTKGCKGKKLAWQTVHNDPSENQREQQTFDQVKKAEFILVTTQWGTKCYKKQISHVDYLPCGIDPFLFVPAIQKQEHFVCLFVSRINYYKGIIPFLDTIPLVLEKEKEIIFSIIAPRDDNSLYLNEIYTKIEELKQKFPHNLTVHLDWIPYAEIPKIYQSASILIFPSNNEGFGIPLIEAMSAKIPCIVLDKKPMSEIIVNKKTGFCLPPCPRKDKNNNECYHGFSFPDPTAIAEKIFLLKKNEKQRQKLGVQGRGCVMQEYALPDVIDKLIKHCRRLANK